MNSFLSNVARDLINSFGSGISDLIVLFPNRRSVRLFSNELSSLLDKPVWAPDIFSVNDWVHSLSSLELAGELDQSIYLYSSLKKNWDKTGSYSEFILWGQMLLRDYDELDKYLLDPVEVFSFLSDEKEIEARFTMLEKEEIRHLQSFWSSLRDKPSDLQQEWLGLWKVLAAVHYDFTVSLLADNMATEGGMYRHSAELVMENQDQVFAGKSIVFVGFNALTRAEEVILEEAHKLKIARFYWDCPPYLLKEHNLSGTLIRGYMKKFKTPASFATLIASAPNRFDPRSSDGFQPIETYSFDSSISQTKIVSHWMKDWSADDNYTARSRKTGIILGEEDLLDDLLLAYSSDLPDIDSSIAYPIVNSEVTALIRQESIEGMNNPLPDKDLHGDSEGLDLLDYWRVIVRKITDKINDLHFRDLALERSVLVLFERFVDKAEKSLRRMPDVLSHSDLLKHYEGWVAQTRIAYESDRDAPVHVTGILETRLIDYDDLIILSFNEGVWPAKKKLSGFIPYHMRMKFSLPVKESQDAIYGYHFFRLIQRAERIRIAFIANANSISNGVGEKSRFLYQFEFDAALQMKQLAVRAGVKLQPAPSDELEKSGAVLDALMRYAGGEKNRRLLSPSAINSYIDCEMQFAYRYLFSMRESDDELELSDPRLFGTVLHGTMELIYSDFAGKSEVSRIFCESMIKDKVQLKKLIREAANIALKETGDGDDVLLSAKDELVLDVIMNYVKIILKTDAAYSPFSIIGLEKKIEAEWLIDNEQQYRVLLGGFVDRMDLKSGVLRIVDYKSGKPAMSFTNWADLIKSKKGSRAKEILQTIIYCYVYNMISSDDYAVKPVLYAMRGLDQGVINQDLIFNKKVITDQSIYLDPAKELIDQVLGEMFDLSTPFRRTINQETCKWCSFNDLCQRRDS